MSWDTSVNHLPSGDDYERWTYRGLVVVSWFVAEEADD